MKKVDKAKIEKAVRLIIEAVGEDGGREGLAGTPARVARMFVETTSGYSEEASEHLGTMFEAKGADGLVLEKDIPFASTCEHHLMPFFGKAHIAYIPDGKVVGLSKLARAVDVFAKRFQLQERLNAEIADAIYAELKPKAVLVVLEAEHTCMTVRGVKKIGSKTLTYVQRGDNSEVLNKILCGLLIEK
jgi:GTP cyclohydrolase I